MNDLFRILEVQQAGEDEAGVYIAIDLRVGGREAPCAISRFCRTEKELEAEAASIRNKLDETVEKARAMLGSEISKEEAWEFTDNMSPEEIWSFLAEIKDDRVFFQQFNELDEKKRRDLAEHVLAECNVFKGKASVFSARYNNETARLE